MQKDRKLLSEYIEIYYQLFEHYFEAQPNTHHTLMDIQTMYRLAQVPLKAWRNAIAAKFSQVAFAADRKDELVVVNAVWSVKRFSEEFK